MPLPIVIAIFFVAAASFLVLLVYLFVPRKTELEERLETLVPKQQTPNLLQGSQKPWRQFLENLGGKVPMRVDDYGKYLRMIVAAGIRKDRLRLFIGAKVFAALSFPGIYLLVYGLPVEDNSTKRLLIAIAFGIVGYLLPSIWLTNKVKKRQARIFYDLPDILDLMTVCVEAGQSIDSSIITICADRNLKNSPLVKEMKLVLQETRAGKPRLDALKDMGERTDVEDVKSFASVLMQTERLGTSLARALRVHSDSFRTIRVQHAQEAAAKTSIKLLFPLIFFILPALFVVMLLPALIRMAKVMSSM